MSYSDSGIALSLDGYNQGTLKLLTAILDVLKTPLLEQNLFDVIKTSLLNNLLNAAKNDPVRQAVERFSCLVHDRTCSSAELAEAMRTTDIEQLKEFSLGLFKRRIIDGFVGGNVTRDSAIEAWHLLSEALPGLPCPTSHVEAAKLQFPISGTGQPQLDILNPNVAGNAMFWNVLVGKRNFENRVGCELLSKLMKEPFYSELRTKQQTGYIVSSGMSQVDKHMFLNAAIQSNSYDARDLLARTELFMQTFQRNIMESVSMEARFGTHFLILDSIKQATIDRLRQPFDRLSTKQEFYNRLIYDEDCNFNLIDERIQSMSDFQFSDMQKFSEEVLLNSYSKRLAVLANGNDEGNKLMSYTNLEYS